jgi:malonyl-CoA O-methyltransferase
MQPGTIALPEPSAARRRFDAAAAGFDAACAAHDYAREILLERLAWLKVDPQLIVDAGCGTGRGTQWLRTRYADARICAVDASQAMLEAAGKQAPGAELIHCDATALPLEQGSVDLLVANLLLPWCDPLALLEECARVLSADGLLLLSTTGPATLQEVRRAWRRVDEDIHAHANLDMQTVGDLLVRAGLREPVLDTERATLQYSSASRLHAELRATGALNAAHGRKRSLTGKARFGRYLSALDAEAASDQPGIDITLELIFAQAWGPDRRAQASPPEPRFHGIAVRSE